jgi:hypothetical protein
LRSRALRRSRRRFFRRAPRRRSRRSGSDGCSARL